MGKIELNTELIKPKNEIKIGGQIATDIAKNAWMYVVILVQDTTNIFIFNSYN